MKIVNIDFDNKEHVSIILKLSKRNKFYEGDINYLVGGILSEETQFFMKKYNKTPFDIYMYTPIYQMEEQRKGYFIMEDKKVVGFMIYYDEIYIKTSRINFLLIDKNYRNMGYGKFLLETVDKTNLYIIVDRVLKSEIDYYIKYGYKLIESFNDICDIYSGKDLEYFKKNFKIEDENYKTLIKK